MKDSLKIAIAGATGYIGLQLIKILPRDKRLDLIKISNMPIKETSSS